MASVGPRAYRPLLLLLLVGSGRLWLLESGMVACIVGEEQINLIFPDDRCLFELWVLVCNYPSVPYVECVIHLASRQALPARKIKGKKGGGEPGTF